MTALSTLAATETLRVEAWTDPVLDALGHDPRSLYVERFWLPVLGPSTICLLRHLVGHLEAEPTGADLDLAEAARALGLGDRSGRNGQFARTVARAVDFDMARLHAGVLGVRRRMPPLSRRHLARLPETARKEHERLAARGEDRHDLDQLRQKGRQLALSLVRLGEDTAATEQQLRLWRFQPELARECAVWADETHRTTA